MPGDLFASQTGQHSLEYVRQAFKSKLRDGTTCPCCDRFAKIYKRKLSAHLARCLILFHKEAGVDWFHVIRLLSKKGVAYADYNLLKHWGLIEPKGDEKDDGNPSAGYWRVTTLGRNFAKGFTWLPTHVLEYLGEFHSFDGQRITIGQALEGKFKYKELMEG